MYRIPEISFSGWSAGDWRSRDAGGESRRTTRGPARFNLLRWISVLGFVAISIVSTVFAAILSHFLTREILHNDAVLTSQFIASLAETESSQATLGQVLDPRADFSALGIDPALASGIRSLFYDHLRFLPDVLLAEVFARDRRIIWSTNKSLVGSTSDGENGVRDLEKAFAAHVIVNTNYVGRVRTKEEREFGHQPQKLYVENYVPLFDARGSVAAVAKIYKEPVSLLQTIRRGKMLVWACTTLAAVVLYLSLFWIIRRADIMLDEQQRRLVEQEALCIIGEMSAAVAHGIRNPLSAIRSSAELALDGDPESTRKNANDIIYQADRLGKWVRDLLLFSRPLAGEQQSVDMVAVAEECVHSFAKQMESAGIEYRFVRPEGVPSVIGNSALIGQALAAIVANAIEAMHAGGSLVVELQHVGHARDVRLVVSDSGSGMSPADCDLVFKPYYTTKSNGLGLGMALVKRIVERFGGSVELHSRKGEGTRVSLTLRTA